MNSLRSVRSVLAAVCTAAAMVVAVLVCPPHVASADDATPFYRGVSAYAYGSQETFSGTYNRRQDSHTGKIWQQCVVGYAGEASWSAYVTPLYVAPGLSTVSYPTGSASVATATQNADGTWSVNAYTYYDHICTRVQSEFYAKYIDSPVTITKSVPVTVQNHYYEFGEAAGTTIDFAQVEGKGDGQNQLELLELFGFDLKDWDNSFAQTNGDKASSVANQYVTFEITKSGGAARLMRAGGSAATDFFNGKEGDYQVTATATNPQDGVPMGGTTTSAPIAVTLTNNARAEAKAVIEAKRAEVSQGLQQANLPNLTDAQREELLKKAEDEADEALAKIEEATSTVGITTAKTDGVLQLQKDLSKGDLEDYAAKAKAEVNGRADLTDAEKSEYAAKVDAEMKKALADDGATGTVDKATTADEVLTAVKDAKAAIDQITVDAAKQDANAALDAKAEEAKKQIDALVNLLDPDENGKTAAQQKSEAKAAIDEALAAAKSQVSDAAAKFKEGTSTADNTKEQIENAKNTAFEAFADQVDTLTKSDVAALNAKKEQVTSELDKKAEAAKNRIDALLDLSEEDRDKAKADVDKAVAQAKQEIASRLTVTDVEQVNDERGQEVDERADQALLDAKAAARKELEAKAAEIDKLIDAKQYLSDEDKQKLHDEVASTLKEHLANVDKAENGEGVAAAKQAGLEALDAIGIKVNKADLEAKADQAKSQVDALQNVDQAFKDKVKAEIDQALDKAKANIDQAASTGQTSAEAEAGIEAIDNAMADIVAEDKTILDDAKAEAIKELKAKAAEVDKLIDAKQYLSEEQKRELHERVAATLAEYIDKVNAAESAADVLTVKQAGLEALEAISVDATRLDEEAAAARAKGSASLAATGDAVFVPALLAVFTLLLGAALALSRRHLSLQ